MPVVQITSVTGGHTVSSHVGESGKFRASLGIDPAQPFDDSDSAYSTHSSGLIRPAASEKFSGTTINAAPLWMVPNPKDSYVYVCDSLGSMYTVNSTFDTVTGLSDAGHLSSGIGNGAAYYDNYIYIAKNTDIARYGPLNGVPSFNGTYWTTTLGLTALTNTTYPADLKNGLLYPNHVMVRHSDGALYIADVVGNLGTVHKLQTTKTSVEGDTNDGSTYSALTMGYGLWPTAMASYGDSLAIALYEGTSGGVRQERAKLAFWDTTSSATNKIVWVDYPDTLITAMKSINGVLYLISGNVNSKGFRITKFLGGYSFDEVYYSETGEPPLPGAVEGTLYRILVGSHTNVPESDGCVYSKGLQKSAFGTGFFNVMRATGGDSSTNVTSVCIADNTELGFSVPIIGWSKGSGTSNNGLDKQATAYNNAPSVFWSDNFLIGVPFNIEGIYIPLAQGVGSNMTLTAKIYIDEGATSYTYPVINNTNFPNGERNVYLKMDGVFGRHSFWLELRWTGSALLTVSLPITIEFTPIQEQ